MHPPKLPITNAILPIKLPSAGLGSIPVLVEVTNE